MMELQDIWVLGEFVSPELHFKIALQKGQGYFGSV